MNVVFEGETPKRPPVEYHQNSPKPCPEGEVLEFEIIIGDRFIVRHFRSYKWQALRYGDDWPACPYPEWMPNNLEAAAFREIAAARGWK